MGVRQAVAALGSALLLVSCGHHSPTRAHGATHVAPSAPAQTTTHYPQPRCIRGSSPSLCASVRRYLIFRENGDLRRAYALLSTRCRSASDFHQFKRRVGLDAPRGMRIGTRLSRNATRGSVTYNLPQTLSTNLAEPWVKEHGKWKNDGCRLS